MRNVLIGKSIGTRRWAKTDIKASTTICVTSYVGEEYADEGGKVEYRVYIGEDESHYIAHFPFEDNL